MKTIEVVAAIIKKENYFLATQRKGGEFDGGWEFPGGKIEANETQEEALIREIKEELQADIFVDSFLCTVEYSYPKFHLVMHCFICSLKSDSINLLEHQDSKWLTKDTIDSVKWLPADIDVVTALKEYLNK